MIRMEIVVNSIEHIFKALGFNSTKHGVYLKNVVSGELSYWAAASADSEGFLVTLGAIAPSVNKFALGLIKKCSEGRIKPQFPSYVVPPIFIPVSVNIPMADIPYEIPKMVNDFENRFINHSVDDWFRMDADLMPYAPAQTIILPAYYYLQKDKDALAQYVDQRHLANPVSDVETYLCTLKEMAGELR